MTSLTGDSLDDQPPRAPPANLTIDLKAMSTPPLVSTPDGRSVFKRKIYTGSEGDVWAALRRPDPPSHASPLSCLKAPCSRTEVDLSSSSDNAHPEWVAVKVIPANSPCQRTYRQLEPLWPRLCAHPHVAKVHEASSEFFSSAASASTPAAPAVSPPAGVPLSPVGSIHPVSSPGVSSGTHPTTASSGSSGDPHPLFDPAAHSGRYFLTQRLYDGDLHQAITFCNDNSAQGPLGFGEPLCARLFQQLASAVAHCHSFGVFHRDVKLENVFVDRETRECFLGDFGEARVLHHHQLYCSTAQSGVPSSSTLPASIRGAEAAVAATTSTSVVVPAAECEIETSSTCSGNSVAVLLEEEVAAGSSARSASGRAQQTLRNEELALLAAADVGGLGVVLYCMVTGHSPRRYHPQQGGSSQLWTPSHLSPALADLLKQLLATSPSQRPSLEQVLHHPWLTLPRLKSSPTMAEVTANQRQEEEQEPRQRAVPVAGGHQGLKRARGGNTEAAPAVPSASVDKPLVVDDEAVEDHVKDDEEGASTRPHAPVLEEPSPRMRRSVTDESNLAAQDTSQSPSSSSAASSTTTASGLDTKRRCVVTLSSPPSPPT